jgi:hypothetical protein
MFRTLDASVIRDVQRDFRMNVGRTVLMESQENNSAKKGILLQMFCTRA